ncbi:hypothetical protein [Demequina litorisediminis]|uniref:hypothetical protein n=1 Tax=Demequina litorisediminis TaxID=1849022 RepID=UPI0024E1422A|nr:hypothetical protein [Demequina litorisediminis]
MSTPVAPRRLEGRLGAIAAAAPERIVLVVVAVAIAAGAMVSVGLHYWWTVLPLAAILVALAWRPLAPEAPRAREAAASAVAGIVAVAGTALWTVVNIAMAAEYLLVVRDPGFLTLSGMWLVDHPSTDIPANGAVEAAAASASFLADASEAWNLAGDVIQPQGAKMLPATIAVGGWFAGDTGVLAANVVIGAAGILATYALARRFLTPLAALAPAGALALTVSHIGLSRPAYTEPLALLLAVAGILYLWRGVERRSTGLIVAGAVATGATTFVRIDGASGAIGTLVGLAVALAIVDAPRAWRRRALVTFALIEAAVLVAGYASLHRWSTEYFERLSSEAYLLLAAYGVLVAIILVWAATWTERLRGDAWLPGLAERLGARGAWWVGGGVIAVMTVLASRPLWTTAHRGTETSREEFTNGVVESLPERPGPPGGRHPHLCGVDRDVALVLPDVAADHSGHHRPGLGRDAHGAPRRRVGRDARVDARPHPAVLGQARHRPGPTLGDSPLRAHHPARHAADGWRRRVVARQSAAARLGAGRRAARRGHRHRGPSAHHLGFHPAQRRVPALVGGQRHHQRDDRRARHDRRPLRARRGQAHRVGGDLGTVWRSEGDVRRAGGPGPGRAHAGADRRDDRGVGRGSADPHPSGRRRAVEHGPVAGADGHGPAFGVHAATPSSHADGP